MPLPVRLAMTKLTSGDHDGYIALGFLLLNVLWFFMTPYTHNKPEWRLIPDALIPCILKGICIGFSISAMRQSKKDRDNKYLGYLCIILLLLNFLSIP